MSGGMKIAVTSREASGSEWGNREPIPVLYVRATREGSIPGDVVEYRGMGDRTGRVLSLSIDVDGVSESCQVAAGVDPEQLRLVEVFVPAIPKGWVPVVVEFDTENLPLGLPTFVAEPDDPHNCGCGHLIGLHSDPVDGRCRVKGCDCNPGHDPYEDGNVSDECKRMRKASGRVDDDRALVAFLYHLARDDVTTGDVEMIVDQLVGKGPYRFTNGWLARWAKDVADRLAQ